MEAETNGGGKGAFVCNEVSMCGYIMTRQVGQGLELRLLILSIPLFLSTASLATGRKKEVSATRVR